MFGNNGRFACFTFRHEHVPNVIFDRLVLMISNYIHLKDEHIDVDQFNVNINLNYPIQQFYFNRNRQVFLFRSVCFLFDLLLSTETTYVWFDMCSIVMYL